MNWLAAEPDLRAGRAPFGGMPGTRLTSVCKATDSKTIRCPREVLTPQVLPRIVEGYGLVRRWIQPLDAIRSPFVAVPAR